MWPTSVDKVWRHRDVQIEFGSVGCVTGVCPRVKRPVCVKCSREQWGGGHKRRKIFTTKKKNTIWVSCSPPSPPPHQCHFPLIWVFLQIFPEGNKRKEMSRRRVTQIEFDGRIDPVGRVHRSPDTGLFGCRSRSRDRLSTNQRPPSKPTRLFFRTWWNKMSFNFLAGATVALVCKWGICPWNVWGRQSANPRC